MTDGDGNRVALGQRTSLVVPKRPRPEGDTGPDRLLSTVLFTVIVGSTKRAEELGDAGWRALLDEHHAFVRKQLQVFRGREAKTTVLPEETGWVRFLHVQMTSQRSAAWISVAVSSP